MRAGQHVYMLNDAANRDAEVFADPHVFDVARHQERMHVSFGSGDPVRQQHIQLDGWERLPVVFGK